MNMHDIFGKCTGAPRKDFSLFDREDRVLALGEWALAVVNGLQRDAQFELFIAFAVQAWLNSDVKTSLCRDHLKTAAGFGNTQHEAKVWRRLKNATSQAEQILPASTTMGSSINHEDKSR